MSKNSTVGEPYNVTSRGTNNSGNSYDHRVTQSGGHGYHYSNRDGSYYYSNPNGSQYYNSGRGYSRYTSPNGYTYQNYGRK